ncbi:unnamed protein product [Phaedon cochleariae]|uniref:Uncharacterized protein n=1 Tax=Phaedon cochleariae TaxID=80249 RepID=A0A9N9SIP2_PHACE|nr:unnamed protein product [Phaedon cochleariae]
MNSGDTSDSHREPVHGSITKELRLIDYKEGSEVFPNMPIWESQGLSVDEMQTAIETSNPILFGQKQTPTNASEDKMYFQLEAIDNNHPIVQPSISEINSYVPNPVQNGSNTDGMMSILTETIEKTQNDDQDFFLEEQSEISQSPIEHHILNSEEIDDIPQVAAPEQRNKGSPIPKLGDIKSVQFRKGSRKMFFKQELEDDEFSEASILKPKFKLELPETVRSDRGINTKKKDIIVRDLLPHMPPRKQIFWMNLPSSDDLEDLGKHIE